MSLNLSDDDDELNSPPKKVKSNFSYIPSLIGTSTLNNKRERDESSVGENLSDSDNDRVRHSFGNNRKKLKQNEVDANVQSNTASSHANKTQQMMMKLGWNPGEGLGKNRQGIVKPIEESDQKGRRGLGFEISGFSASKEDWDFAKDQVSAKEIPEWLSNDYKEVPDLSTLLTWKKQGFKKAKLDDEYEFCSPTILKDVLECKSIFDNLENHEMIKARTRSNPFETIGSCIFQNRAAMKMANIDSVFDEMFTNPKDSFGRSKIEANEPLYFCDVCAGPGGFSEYVLWRKKINVKGFGFTLKGDCDFKLNDFLVGAPELFEPHYGVNVLDGDGDVTRTDNINEFKSFVRQSTCNRGVHFMMADGGFSVDGKENIQEILSKQLYLCQFLTALCVLRTGGNFVCKLFDLFTPFSVGLVYLMYLCFERICIHKPVTSRPANSERYIICEGMKESKSIIESYLFHINDELNKTFRNEIGRQDVTSIVPLEILKDDSEFFNYIKNSNEKFGEIQCLNLKKIQLFARNKNLIDHRQEELRQECLNLWKVPNETREKKPKKYQHKKFNTQPILPSSPNDVFAKLNNELINSKLQMDMNSIITYKLKEINHSSLLHTFNNKSSIYDYRCMIANGELVLLLGCGRTNVYQCEINSHDNLSSIKWEKLNKSTNIEDAEAERGYEIELPRDTLVLAEKVREYRGEEKGQFNLKAIHIIDAFFINGVNMILSNDKIRSLPERASTLQIFEMCMKKITMPNLDLIRVKDIIRMEQIGSVFDNLKIKKCKQRNAPLKFGIHLPINNPSECYVYPTGIYFFRFVSAPWTIHLSKTQNKKYYFNFSNNQSTFEAPNDDSFCATPKYYLENGFFWRWTQETKIEEDILTITALNSTNNQDALTKNKLLEFISQKR